MTKVEKSTIEALKRIYIVIDRTLPADLQNRKLHACTLACRQMSTQMSFTLRVLGNGVLQKKSSPNGKT